MEFTTERLTLRSLNQNDAADILEVRSNENINTFIKRTKPKCLQDASDFINKITINSTKNEILFLGISEKSCDKIIGTISLWKFSEDRRTAELGYELLPQFHKLGYMSEAVSFMIDYGFNQLNLHKIEAFTNKNNEPSIQLLKKFQFVRNENRTDAGNLENAIFELVIHK